MNASKKIILFDSDEACIAGIVTWGDGTTTNVWKSTDEMKQFIHTDERLARWSGCTHKICPVTGEIFEKIYIDGPTERARKSRERYLNLRQREDGCELFWGEDFFPSPDELITHIVNQYGPEITKLDDIVWAEPMCLNHVEESHLIEDTHESITGVSDNIKKALKALNDAIDDNGVEWYATETTRPTDSQITEWEQSIAKGIRQLKNEAQNEIQTRINTRD